MKNQNGFEPKFVFTADNHIKRRIWKDNSQVEYDTYNSVNQITDYCRANELPLVIGGDFFDSRYPSAEDVLFAMQTLHGVDTYWLDGNHDGYKHIDATVNASWSDVLKVKTLTDPVDINGITVQGCPFKSKEDLEPSLKSLPSSDVLVCHQLLKEIVEYESMANMEAEWVPTTIQTILMGDYHKPKSYMDLSGQTFQYCGSTAPMRISENEGKFSIVVGRHNGSVKLECVPLITRLVQSYTVEKEEHIGQTLSTIKRLLKAEQHRQEDSKYYDAVKLAVVRVLYDSSLEGVQSIATSLRGLASVQFTPISSDGLRIDSSASEEVLVDESEIISTMVDKSTDPNLYEFALGLAQVNADYTAVFKSTREKLGVKERVNDS